MFSTYRTGHEGAQPLMDFAGAFGLALKYMAAGPRPTMQYPARAQPAVARGSGASNALRRYPKRRGALQSPASSARAICPAQAINHRGRAPAPTAAGCTTRLRHRHGQVASTAGLCQEALPRWDRQSSRGPNLEFARRGRREELYYGQGATAGQRRPPLGAGWIAKNLELDAPYR